jgi:hypothetical protein
MTALATTAPRTAARVSDTRLLGAGSPPACA